MPPTSSATSFHTNANMNMQHQRMQPPPPSSTSTQSGQRALPFGGGQHNTPPGSVPPQPQFITPQNASHLQTPEHNQQAHGGQALTPQTPTFPSTSNAGSSIATPLSPGSEQKEKERVTVLLDINTKLLMEVMRIQSAQQEFKKGESSPVSASAEGSDKEKAEKEKAEKEKADKAKAPSSREYFEYVSCGSLSAFLRC